MNKQVNRELSAVCIRDYADSPKHRKAMGFFKHQAYLKGITQAEMLNQMIGIIYKLENRIDISNTGLNYKKFFEVKDKVETQAGIRTETIDLKELGINKNHPLIENSGKSHLSIYETPKKENK